MKCEHAYLYQRPCRLCLLDTVKELEADCQTLYKRVTALGELWGASIKNNEGLRKENKKLKDLLERVLVEVREYRPPGMGLELMLEISRFFNPSSRL